MSRKCVGLLALFVSAAALAAPGLVIDRIHGDPGPLRNQLASDLCKPIECVPLKSVETGKGLDWKAVEQKDARVLAGSVTGGTRAGSLSLTLSDRKDHVVGRWSYPLSAGRLSKEAVGSLTTELRTQLGVQPPSRATVALVPAPLPTVPTAVAPGAMPLAVPPQPVTNQSVPPGEAFPLISARVGASMLNADLHYEGLSTNNLRGYHANFVFAPRVEIDAYPLAHVLSGWGRGLGLTFGYEQAVGLESATAGGVNHPTHYHSLDLAATLSWHPFHSSSFLFQPLIGARLAGFSIDQVAGATLAGLPDLTFNGLRVGAGMAYDVWKLRLIGRASFLPALNAGQLLTASFFPKGSLYGWEVEAGAVYPFAKHWDARAVLDYTRYHYSFNTVPGDLYVATGATNRYFGGRLIVGYTFD